MAKTVKIEMPLDEAMYLCACMHGIVNYLDKKCEKDSELYSSTAQLIVANKRIQDAIVNQCHPDEIEKITKG